MKRLIFIIGLITCFGTATGTGITTAHARDVYYNTQTHIWHNGSCQHSHCKNCIKINQTDAERRGGRACKKCGG